MRRALVIPLLLGIAIAASSLFFRGTTLVFVALAMGLVAFFAGSAVVLGAYTRRATERRPPADAEVIPDDPDP